MKTVISVSTILALATLFFSFCTPKVNPEQDLKSKLENLSGTYADAKPYAYGQAWGQRIFTFDKGKWTLKFTLALDPDMKMQVFEFRTVGSYAVLDKSKSLADTYQALFLEDKKFITLKTSDANLINTFGFAPCGFTKDVELDISANGCSAWKAVSICNQDHDLLSLDSEGKLYFGERPADNDMCSADKRPTKLTPPVTKAN
jgi:hypothetical protein